MMKGVRRLHNLVLQGYKKLTLEKGIFYGFRNVYKECY